MFSLKRQGYIFNSQNKLVSMENVLKIRLKSILLALYTLDVYEKNKIISILVSSYEEISSKAMKIYLRNFRSKDTNEKYKWKIVVIDWPIEFLTLKYINNTALEAISYLKLGCNRILLINGHYFFILPYFCDVRKSLSS